MQWATREQGQTYEIKKIILEQKEDSNKEIETIQRNQTEVLELNNAIMDWKKNPQKASAADLLMQNYQEI